MNSNSFSLFYVVVVPDRSLVLDWVFADGPPQRAKVYDNNNWQDFHALVPRSVPEELFWDEEEQNVYNSLRTDRKLREEAKRLKVCSFGCFIIYSITH